MPADFPMQATHAIHRPAAADRQIGHVETLRRVVRILAAQGEQVVECDAELLLGITTEVFFDESRSETIEAGGHSRMGGEEVARARDRQRDFEGLPRLFHEAPRAFQHGEGRMSFIQMADLRLDAERGKQSPSADPKHHLLLEAQLRPAPVKLAGNGSVNREVRQVIAVEKVKLHSAHLNLPDAKPDGVTWQVKFQPQPLPVRVAQRRDGQLPGIVVREKGLLRALSRRSPVENSLAGKAGPRRSPARPDRWRP